MRSAKGTIGLLILAAAFAVAAWFSFQADDPAFPDRPDGKESPEPTPAPKDPIEPRDAIVPPPEELPFRTVEVLIEEGEARRALAVLDRAVVKDPKDAAAWALKGEANLDLQLWRQAEKDYARAIELSGETAAKLDGRARALMHIRKEKEAVKLLNRSLELSPDRARPHALLARIHLNAGRAKEAAAEARLALAIDPAEPMALSVEKTLGLPPR